MDISESMETEALSQPLDKCFDFQNGINNQKWLHDNDDMDVVFDQKDFPLRERATQKTVSFGANVVHEVISRHEYTDDEKFCSWLDAEDFRRRQEVSLTEARLLDWGHFYIIENETTTRGLEGYTRDGRNLRRQRRFYTYLAVFSEIDYQDDEDISDEIAIANASLTTSQSCVVAAQLFAQHDELEAREIYNDP